MSDSVLTIVFCGVLPMALVIATAIWGATTRTSLVGRIMAAYQRGDFKDLSAPPNAARMRALAIVAAVCAIGVVALAGMIITNVLPLLTDPVLIAYLTLASIGAIAGIALYREVSKRIK